MSEAQVRPASAPKCARVVSDVRETTPGAVRPVHPVGGHAPLTTQRSTKFETTADDWLSRVIEQRRRAARRDFCPRCGARVWIGDDHDRCAVRVIIDASPVDALHEVVELLRGGSSFDLVPRGRGFDIWHREWEHVHSARRPYPVHMRHRCNSGI